MSRGVWLAAAGASAGLAALIWLLAFRVDATQRRDGRALYELEKYDDTTIGNTAEWVLRFGDPIPFAVLSLVLAWVALRRLGAHAAVVVGVGLLIAGATTQLLQLLLEEERVHALIPPGDIASTAWPSGHSTAAMSLALFAVIVVPPELRRRTAWITVPLAVLVGLSVSIDTWHYPSDALGGFAVASAWACAALAVLRRPASARAATAAPRRRSHRATG